MDSRRKGAGQHAGQVGADVDRLLSMLAEAIINGERGIAAETTAQLLDQGSDPKLVLERGLIAGMDVVGTRFKLGEYFVPQVLVATRAMKSSMEELRPRLLSANVQPLGTMVLGTIRGDLHDIGKSLVGMMTEGAGFRVIDLGVDVAPAKFVAAAREHNATLVGVSTLLTTTMMMVPEVINAIEAAGLRGKIKVIVGGAPVTRQWAAEVGADAYAPDAASAVDRCRELVKSL
jgi:5-methyltetrahydrofolate--homocysteine methyltransferase